MVLPFDLRRISSRPTAQQSLLSSSASQEALSRTSSATRANSRSSTERAQREEVERKALNDDLITLAALFPDVQFEVFRELLVKFDGESRLQIALRQLIKYRTQWVRGRWHVPPRNIDDNVPLDCSFRSTEYKTATLQFLSQEFRYLSKSTVKGVLAENNYSYTRARQTLSNLSNRTWRATIGNLNIFRKKKTNDASPTELLAKVRRMHDGLGTGSVELDEEMQTLFLRPAERMEKQRQEEQDQRVAEELNEAEARKVNALYDCECCCGQVTFEKLSSCTTGAHLICSDCIRHTIHEAIFGQGWGSSIDSDRGALKCLAPLVDDMCDGCISPPAMRQAILAERSGPETWAKLEHRLAEDSLLKSQLKLIRCPFCPYAEVDPSHCSGSIHTPKWRINAPRSLNALITMVIVLDFLPVILSLAILFSASRLVQPFKMFQTSIRNLSLRDRSPRFKCRNPACGRASCLKCQKAWHDPHTCHEPLVVSLRTTVEAARTAAIKRTCPRCGLSFVKASGCNKLTCVCGYSMCYLCRTALGSSSFLEIPRAQRPVHDREGYRHFCEHFRVNPGKPCTECRKCDLYRSEDEDAIVKRAGEIAEQEWRMKEGMVGVEGLGEIVGHEKKSWFGILLSGEWTVQGTVDWVVGRLIEVDY